MTINRPPENCRFPDIIKDLIECGATSAAKLSVCKKPDVLLVGYTKNFHQAMSDLENMSVAEKRGNIAMMIIAAAGYCATADKMGAKPDIDGLFMPTLRQWIDTITTDEEKTKDIFGTLRDALNGLCVCPPMMEAARPLAQMAAVMQADIAQYA